MSSIPEFLPEFNEQSAIYDMREKFSTAFVVAEEYVAKMLNNEINPTVFCDIMRMLPGGNKLIAAATVCAHECDVSIKEAWRIITFGR